MCAVLAVNCITIIIIPVIFSLLFPNVCQYEGQMSCTCSLYIEWWKSSVLSVLNLYCLLNCSQCKFITTVFCDAEKINVRTIKQSEIKLNDLKWKRDDAERHYKNISSTRGKRWCCCHGDARKERSAVSALTGF